MVKKTEAQLLNISEGHVQWRYDRGSKNLVGQEFANKMDLLAQDLRKIWNSLPSRTGTLHFIENWRRNL